MSKPKLEKYDEFYERLGTKKFTKEVYKLAMGRENQTRNFKNM